MSNQHPSNPAFSRTGNSKFPKLVFCKTLLLRAAGILGLVGIIASATWVLLIAFDIERSRLHWLLMIALLCEYAMILFGSIAGMLAIGGKSAVSQGTTDSLLRSAILAKGIIRRLATTSIVLSIAAGLLYLAMRQHSPVCVSVFRSTFQYLTALAIINVILFVVAAIWCPPWDEGSG